jgi:hypothetical protein
MNMDAIPFGVLFAATIIVVMSAIWAGFRLGHAAHRWSVNEKESPVSTAATAILTLVGFILAFTFSIVSDRYDARMALVRDEANVIGTAWLRSDFLPEPDRSEAAALIRDYVDLRLDAVRSRDFAKIKTGLIESDRIQRQLWDMAVRNARKDMNSNVGALYIESLNALIDIHALRVAIGLHVRIPGGIWQVLYALVILGMIGVGYQAAIAGSTRKSWAMPILAFSFSLVIALIISLDRPQSDFITVSQQPLADLRATMTTGLEARLDLGDKH